tara:strand:- start:1318 stop:2493 length:1176 start_codon:yes stop_codon:yes gene_type:complete
MAYYFIFPEKDTTIYSHPNRETINTGHDEIIELVKEKGSTNQKFYPSRILIHFSDENIMNVINILGDGSFTSSLQLFSAEHQNLNINQNIEVYPLSSSWLEGTGRYHNLPTSSNGCSWIYKDGNVKGNKWTTGSFGQGSTGSIDPSSGITPGGGEWYDETGFIATQSFSNANSLDLDIDVTTIVQKFSASIFESQVYPQGIPNNGFILKYPKSNEIFTSGSTGDLQYFSRDTHTIYPPKLAFKWDDSTHSNLTYVDGVGNIFTTTANTSPEKLNVSLFNNKGEYNQNEVATFRLHIREKYPIRSFTSSSNYLNVGHFKTSSYYSIRDAHTEEVIIPFDDYNTKLSSNSEGMFFKLYMNGLQPERHYRILFKTTNNFGTVVFDNNYHFKVVR